MFCYHCGAQHDDDVKFCTKCGADLRAPAEQAAYQAPQYQQQTDQQPQQPYQQPYQQPQTPYQQPYQAPYQQPYYRPVAEPGKGFAITSLVLGICALLIYPIITGVLAIIFGAVAKSKGNTGGMATAGIVCGSIGVAWFFIALAIGISFFL